MNTQEKFEKMLCGNGMFPNQAKQVMEEAKKVIDADMKNIKYQMTWDRPADEYDQVLYTVLYNSAIKQIALKWIDNNVPNAWFRSMFLPKEEMERLLAQEKK